VPLRAALLTRMGHVEQSTSSVPLNSHILRLRQPSEGDERTGLGDLRLVLIYNALFSCDAITNS
jgi:hypothetical protein